MQLGELLPEAKTSLTRIPGLSGQALDIYVPSNRDNFGSPEN
jgi:hypothetical protein